MRKRENKAQSELKSRRAGTSSGPAPCAHFTFARRRNSPLLRPSQHSALRTGDSHRGSGGTTPSCSSLITLLQSRSHRLAFQHRGAKYFDNIKKKKNTTSSKECPKRLL
ncbi:uncharacterized [Tachysurus ichikawai]